MRFLTLTDFVVEIRVRKPLRDVYGGERVTHAVMGILYGAMVARAAVGHNGSANGTELATMRRGERVSSIDEYRHPSGSIHGPSLLPLSPPVRRTHPFGRAT